MGKIGAVEMESEWTAQRREENRTLVRGPSESHPSLSQPTGEDLSVGARLRDRLGTLNLVLGKKR